MIGVGLFQYLTADSGIAALVNGRIYRDTIFSKGALLPNIVFFKTNTDDIDSLDGENSTREYRFQFSCFARTKDEADELAELVHSRLIPRSDSSGPSPTPYYDLPDGTHIQSARLHDARDLPAEEGPGETIRHSMLEINFTFENS
jgi:Protein of unknown function (DUF3168)